MQPRINHIKSNSLLECKNVSTEGGFLLERGSGRALVLSGMESRDGSTDIWSERGIWEFGIRAADRLWLN